MINYSFVSSLFPEFNDVDLNILTKNEQLGNYEICNYPDKRTRYDLYGLSQYRNDNSNVATVGYYPNWLKSDGVSNDQHFNHFSSFTNVIDNVSTHLGANNDLSLAENVDKAIKICQRMLRCYSGIICIETGSDPRKPKFRNNIFHIPEIWNDILSIDNRLRLTFDCNEFYGRFKELIDDFGHKIYNVHLRDLNDYGTVLPFEGFLPIYDIIKCLPKTVRNVFFEYDDDSVYDLSINDRINLLKTHINLVTNKLYNFPTNDYFDYRLILKDYVKDYIKIGWPIIPVMFRNKETGLADWKKSRSDFNHLCGLFNVAIKLGFGLIDIDLDNKIAIDLADKFLPKTNAIFGRGNKPSHYIYQSDGPSIEFKHVFNDQTVWLGELRSHNQYTVIPPSLHISGQNIRWFNDDFTPTKIDYHVLLSCVKSLMDETIKIMSSKINS